MNELETDELHISQNAYLKLLVHTHTHTHTFKLSHYPRERSSLPWGVGLGYMCRRTREASVFSQPTKHPCSLPFPVSGCHSS